MLLLLNILCKAGIVQFESNQRCLASEKNWCLGCHYKILHIKMQRTHTRWFSNAMVHLMYCFFSPLTTIFWKHKKWYILFLQVVFSLLVFPNFVQLLAVVHSDWQPSTQHCQQRRVDLYSSCWMSQMIVDGKICIIWLWAMIVQKNDLSVDTTRFCWVMFIDMVGKQTIKAQSTAIPMAFPMAAGQIAHETTSS